MRAVRVQLIHLKEVTFQQLLAALGIVVSEGE
jgi:hypothetical protein